MKKGNTKRKNDIIFMLFALVLGLFMGWAAWDVAEVGILGALTCNIGIWVFVSAFLAIYTQEAFRAALHVLLYFVGVIGGYFGNCVIMGGNVSFRMLLYWLIFAAIGALVGFIDWHSAAKEWLGAACTAVPISLLVAEGYDIYKGFSIVLAFDIVCAVVLYIVMARGKMQKLMALPFIIVFTFALVYFHVLSSILGGWI